MGVNTKGFIRQDVSEIEMKQIIEMKLGVDVQMHDTSFPDYFVMSFTYKGEGRDLSFFRNNTDRREDIGITNVVMSVKCWGQSVEIMRLILEAFGGFLLESDSNDEYEYIEATSNMEERSEKEQLEAKIYASMSGYDLKFKEKMNLVRYVMENKEFLQTI